MSLKWRRETDIQYMMSGRLVFTLTCGLTFGFLWVCGYLSDIRKVKYSEENEADYSEEVGMNENEAVSRLPPTKPPLVLDMNASDFMQSLSHRGSAKRKRFPSCILIGERKTGTTALLRFLEMHPQLKASHKEVHFFDNENHYSKGLQVYLDAMPPSLPHEVTFEKSPSYFRTQAVPERIASLNNDVKLLLSVRDPIKRAVSDFHFCREMNFVSFNTTLYGTFEEYVIDPNTFKVNIDFPPIERSFYDVHLSYWLPHFNLTSFFIVNGDSFATNNPAAELKNIERFLGLDSFFRRDMFYFDDVKGYYCLRSKGCLFTGSSHPEVNPLVIKELRAVFAPHNERFYRMVRKDFGWPS